MSLNTLFLCNTLVYGYKQLFVYKHYFWSEALYYCSSAMLALDKVHFKYWAVFGLNVKNSPGLGHEIEFILDINVN